MVLFNEHMYITRVYTQSLPHRKVGCAFLCWQEKNLTMPGLLSIRNRRTGPAICYRLRLGYSVVSAAFMGGVMATQKSNRSP